MVNSVQETRDRNKETTKQELCTKTKKISKMDSKCRTRKGLI